MLFASRTSQSGPIAPHFWDQLGHKTLVKLTLECDRAPRREVDCARSRRRSESTRRGSSAACPDTVLPVEDALATADGPSVRSTPGTGRMGAARTACRFGGRRNGSLKIELSETLRYLLWSMLRSHSRKVCSQIALIGCPLSSSDDSLSMDAAIADIQILLALLYDSHSLARCIRPRVPHAIAVPSIVLSA